MSPPTTNNNITKNKNKSKKPFNPDFNPDDYITMPNRHERRPSQRVPSPPSTDSISSFLNPYTRISQQLFQTQILNNAQPSTARNTAGIVDVEPLPKIDYHLLYMLIKLARSHLEKRDFKRYDYLADARKTYYLGHSKFQVAYGELQDAAAYGETLDALFDKLAAKAIVLEQNENFKDAASESKNESEKLAVQAEMASVEINRRRNNEVLRQLLLNVDKRAKARDNATRWFSSLKWKFLQTEMPVLVDIGKQAHAYQNGKQSTPPVVGPLPPFKKLSTDAATFFGLNESKGSGPWGNQSSEDGGVGRQDAGAPPDGHDVEMVDPALMTGGQAAAMGSKTTTAPHYTSTPSSHEAATAIDDHTVDTADHKPTGKGKQAMSRAAVDNQGAAPTARQDAGALQGIHQGATDGALQYLQQGVSGEILPTPTAALGSDVDAEVFIPDGVIFP